MQREKKPDKIQRFINILICILPIIALAVLFTYNVSQKGYVDKTVEALEAGDTTAALEMMAFVEDINMSGSDHKTILMAACKYGNAEVIIAALNQNADPNAHLSGTLTPLEYFCSTGYTAGEGALFALLKAGANPKVYTTRPALYTLTEQFKWMEKETKESLSEEVTLLLQAGSPLTYNGTTILHYLAQHNFSELVTEILKTPEGVEMAITKDPDGYYPYNLAVKSGAVQAQRAIREWEAAYTGNNEPTFEPSTETEPSNEPTIPGQEDMSLEDWMAILDELNNPTTSTETIPSE